MSTMQVSARLSARELDLTDVELRRWVNAMRSRLPASVRQLTSPKWLGLYCDDTLYAAMSYSHQQDGSVFIDGLVCRPDRLGRQYAVALYVTLRTLWKGKRISFCVSLANRKMLKALNQLTTAKAVAAVFEMEA